MPRMNFDRNESRRGSSRRSCWLLLLIQLHALKFVADRERLLPDGDQLIGDNRSGESAACSPGRLPPPWSGKHHAEDPDAPYSASLVLAMALDIKPLRCIDGNPAPTQGFHYLPARMWIQVKRLLAGVEGVVHPAQGDQRDTEVEVRGREAGIEIDGPVMLVRASSQRPCSANAAPSRNHAEA